MQFSKPTSVFESVQDLYTCLLWSVGFCVMHVRDPSATGGEKNLLNLHFVTIIYYLHYDDSVTLFSKYTTEIGKLDVITVIIVLDKILSFRVHNNLPLVLMPSCPVFLRSILTLSQS